MQRTFPDPFPDPLSERSNDGAAPVLPVSADPSHAPVRWGILSTALIATQKTIPAMARSRGVDLAAIASRSVFAAQAAAASLGIRRAHGAYNALLADPEIEAVYIPLPNSLHVPMTLMAAKAGKHVLCERPMALGADDIEALRPYAMQVHLREAMTPRFHPQWIAALEMLLAGAIGEPRLLHAALGYFNEQPTNVRNMAELGGGAMHDIGGLAAFAARWFFGREPIRAVAALDRDPRFGVDRTVSGWLDFGGGSHATFGLSMQTAPHDRLAIVGSAGRLELEAPFHLGANRPSRILVHSAGGSERTVEIEPDDPYRRQMEAFSSAVRQEAPNADGLEEAAANARVIDALLASGNSGRIENVTPGGRSR